MLRKIILPLVLLIFTQQEFYGMEEGETKGGENANKDIVKKLKKKNKTKEIYIKKQCDFWGKVHKYMNGDKLPYLWMFLDNVPFQYGGSKKIWEHGEAYYGLSNGIGFFPSALNFGWLKIGIGDAHINVINTIIKYMKTYTEIKYDYCYKKNDKSTKEHKNSVWLNSLIWWLFYTVVTDIHLFSFNFFNCVKIKIISIGAVVTSKINEYLLDNYDDSWYFSFDFEDEQLRVPGYYFILSPRIEINIPGIIDYFKGKKFLHTRHRRTI